MQPHDFTWFFLSVRGRISRQEFWLGCLTVVAVLWLIVRPAMSVLDDYARSVEPPLSPDDLEQVRQFPLLVAALFAMWPLTAIYAKRLHDLNLSAWWVVLYPASGLVCHFAGIDNPVVAFVISYAIGFIPGVKGANRFGDDPLTPAR
jgi:uncharacterized membrane protein YhaH (DUF805 family)